MTKRIGLVRVCAFAAVLLALTAVDAAGRTISLAWEASADATVAGYRVYWSLQSGSYNDADSVDVGNSLRWIGDLPGDQYYLAIRAYDADGNLGPLSLEVGDTTAFWLSNPGDQATEAGQAVVVALLAHGAVVTYDVDGLPAGLAVDPVTGQIFGTLIPSDASSTTQLVTARAVGATGRVSSVQFYWTVRTNHGPIAVNPGDQSNAGGDAVALPIDARDPDADGLHYSASGLPSGLTIEPTSGIISGTISPTAAGVLDVSVAISDGRAVTTVRFAWQILTDDSGLTVDRVVSADSTESTATTLTTPPFSTALAGETLIAFVETAQPVSAGVVVSGAGLQWSLVTRAKAQAGSAEIWWARAPARLSNVTVTAAMNAGETFLSLTVVSFAGADGVGASASASAAAGAPAVSLTTTRAGSFVFGAGNDWDGAASRVVPAGQAIVHEAFGHLGDTFWVQRLSGATAGAGTPISLMAIAPTDHQWNFAAVEIVARAPAAPVPVGLSIGDVSMRESGPGPSPMTFTVTLSGASAVPVSVRYATVDGTAKVGRDYVPQSGTLVFPPGTTKRTIAVPIAGDRKREDAETFSVMLSRPTNAVIADAQGVGTILDAKTANEMFGSGAIANGRLRDRIVFRLKEGNQRDYARLEFWSSELVKGKGIDDEDRRGSSDNDYRRDHRAAKNRFESTAITSIVFGARAGNTQSVTFAGAGAWNGQAGYTFEALAADRGEPGRNRDTVTLVVKDGRGSVVLNVSATIESGNIESHRSR